MLENYIGFGLAPQPFPAEELDPAITTHTLETLVLGLSLRYPPLTPVAGGATFLGACASRSGGCSRRPDSEFSARQDSQNPEARLGHPAAPNAGSTGNITRQNGLALGAPTGTVVASPALGCHVPGM